MVVATVGRPGRLPGLVEAVLVDPAARELVVVVDGDDPASVAVLRKLALDRPALRPAAIPHRGHLGALEQGVRLAHGAVVVLLDDDILPAPDLVSRHLSHHQDGASLVVAGAMPVRLTQRASVGTRLYAAEYLDHLAALQAGRRPLLDALWAGNLSMRRDDCLRIGLASDRFPVFYHSDRDLGYRLADAGLAGRFDPTIRAWHLHQRNDLGFLRDARRQGAGRRALHRAHPHRLGPFRAAQLLDDLPVPLRGAVLLAGSTPAARPLARTLMAVGRACAATGHLRPQLVLARLARRIMIWRGATAGDGEAVGP